MDRKTLNALGQITQLGLNIVVPILLCTLVGNYIDKKIQGRGIVLILFIVIGVGAGFSQVFRLGRKDQ